MKPLGWEQVNLLDSFVLVTDSMNEMNAYLKKGVEDEFLWTHQTEMLKCWNIEILFYHKIQITIKQDGYTKASESGEEARKETIRLIDIGLPQSKNKVKDSKARIESKIRWK